MKELLRRMLDAGIDSARPELVVPQALPPRPRGRVIVVGAGKAAAAMARAVEDHWGAPLEGLVVTRYGHSVHCNQIEVVEAGHPRPDEAGMSAAHRMLKMVSALTSNDFVLCLLSGGGSSLLTAPLAGIRLSELQPINDALLRSGASIAEINCVRRHLSATAGGRLAAACHPAKVLSLAISDVPGDAPGVIASGPTTADPTTCSQALQILRRYGIDAPPSVHDVLLSGRGESVKPGDARLGNTELRLIATPQGALEAAIGVAATHGYQAHILGDAIEGEAREVGKVMAGIARYAATRPSPFRPPCVLLSGGETTVTITGDGRGGRNAEFLLSLGLNLQESPRIHALAADTDGVDGLDEVAGAYWGPDTLARARELGLSAASDLFNNNAHGFFRAVGTSIVTGPTRTNVNDFRAILIEP